MQVEKVINYLLIGNLLSGKVIYEMSNTIDPKTLYEANLIFNNYQKKKHHTLNTKIEYFTISIFIDNIIMIVKTDDVYPIERNFELFKIIKKSIPDLSELSLDWNLNLYKQSLNEKITKIIFDYFNDINSSRKVLNTMSYIKNDVSNIIEEESDENKIDSSNSSQNGINKKNRSNKRNSLISNSIIGDNISLKDIKLDKTVYLKKSKTKIFNDKNKKVSINLIDDTEENKTNMYKSLIQSSSLVKINNNNDNIKIPNAINDTHITNKYVNEMKDIVWKITCCKKIICFFIILIIIIICVVIPLIIKYTYSY